MWLSAARAAQGGSSQGAGSIGTSVPAREPRAWAADEERTRSKQDKGVPAQRKQACSGQVNAEAPGAYAVSPLCLSVLPSPEDLSLSPRILMTHRDNGLLQVVV